MAQPVEYEQLTYNDTGGAQFGRRTTDLISFYGATPLVQQTVDSAISTTLTVSTAGRYGFVTSTETMEVVNAVSTMAYALKQLGLVA